MWCLLTLHKNQTMFKVRPHWKSPWQIWTPRRKEKWASLLIRPAGSGPYEPFGGAQYNHHPAVQCRCAYYRRQLADKSQAWTSLRTMLSILWNSIASALFLFHWNITFWGFYNWGVHCSVVQWGNQVVLFEKITVHTPLEGGFNFGKIIADQHLTNRLWKVKTSSLFT